MPAICQELCQLIEHNSEQKLTYSHSHGAYNSGEKTDISE